MKRRTMPERKSAKRAGQGLHAASRSAASLPLKLLGRTIGRAIQVVFALFVVVLHPQIKWLVETAARSRLVRNVIEPAFRSVIETVFDPYFAALKELPPVWATFSIALPLAVLEPAKFVATVMIAARPKVGLLLWLFLQGVSFVLIDRTWAAVRPQARKIRIVSRLHAYAWLNVAYGKHWIETSVFYTALARWKEEARGAVRAFFARLARRRGGGRLR
jgi:hypothetical protein